MEQEDLEEGEISDSDEETSAVVNAVSADSAAVSTAYSLLPRPTNPAMSYRAPQESLGLPPAHSFRDSPARLAVRDSDGDSNPSDDEVSEKRAKLQTVSISKKRSVWSDVLLEQQISCKIQSGGITADDVDTVERGVESYRPSGESRTVGIDEFEREKEVVHGELWDVNDDGESNNTSKKKKGKKKKRRVKDRLDLDYDGKCDDYEDHPPNEICAKDDERVIARYIARHLNEPKVVLMERVTRFAGREKALELFNATMDIEAAGGMTTMTGDTRRTPGGVFLQLLKKDKGVSKETVKDIFAVERDNQKFAKKVMIKDKQIRKRKYYSKYSDTATPSPSNGHSTHDLDITDEPDIEIGVVQ